MTDTDFTIAALRAELSACRDEVNRLPVDWDTEIDAYARSNDVLRGQVARLKTCLGFFASVIKSGEQWTNDCEERYRAAFRDD